MFVVATLDAADVVQSFDNDPGWEKFGEFANEPPSPTIKQDFGWRPTTKAGGAKPGENWAIDYDPEAGNGNGHITVALDGEKAELDLKPGTRQAGATFDRFGFFDQQMGGHFVKVCADDITYTGIRSSR